MSICSFLCFYVSLLMIPNYKRKDLSSSSYFFQFLFSKTLESLREMIHKNGLTYKMRFSFILLIHFNYFFHFFTKIYHFPNYRLWFSSYFFVFVCRNSSAYLSPKFKFKALFIYIYMHFLRSWSSSEKKRLNVDQ